MNLSMGELLSAPHRVIDIVVYTANGHGYANPLNKSYLIKEMIKNIPLKENEGLKNIQIQFIYNGMSIDSDNGSTHSSYMRYTILITATKVEFIKNKY